MDLKRIREKMIEWGVDPSEADDFMSEFENPADEAKAPVQSENPNEANGQGGEPADSSQVGDKDDIKTDEGKPAPAISGGEPEAEADTGEAKDRKIEELQTQIKDLKDTLDGFSAAQKRIEELVGSLGTRVAKGRPFGEIKGSDEREADKSGEAGAKATMDAFAKMAGRR